MNPVRALHVSRITLSIVFLAFAACQPRTSNVSEERPRTRGGDLSPPQESIGKTAATPFGQIFADSPIHWRPFGPQAFAAAEASGRPVMVLSGFSTCPFTRSLAAGAISDPDLADFCNSNFVCALLDSEEYQVATDFHLEMMKRMGGVAAWPMILWTDSKGVPIYMHPFLGKDAFSAPALMSSAEAAVKRWTDDAEVMRVASGDLWSGFVAGTLMQPPGSPTSTPTALLGESYHYTLALHDATHGSISPAQNFVRPLTLTYLLDLEKFFRDGDFRHGRIRETVVNCLDSIARGAIRDPLDGGFFRYSEKPTWNAPRSEKTLADQALIALLYQRAAAEFNEPRYLEIAASTLNYVRNHLRREDGLFAASATAFEEPSAPAPPFLSRYFRWNLREIEDLLDPEQFSLVRRIHGLDRMPEPLLPDTGGRNLVLGSGQDLAQAARALGITPEQAAETLVSAHAKLLKARAARPGYFRDDRAQLAGNALMVTALAAQAAATEEPPTEAAELFAKLRSMFAPEGEVIYQSEWNGRLTPLDEATDMLLAIEAALNLHKAGGGTEPLEIAKRWFARFEERYVDPEIGTVTIGRGSVMMPEAVPRVSLPDGVLPADAALHARVLRMLSEATGDDALLAKRDRVLESLTSAGRPALAAFTLLGELAIREVARKRDESR